MQLGIIEEGKLKGRKIILHPREKLLDNIYLVEKGTFFNGAPMFSPHCLVCENEINSDVCENQDQENHK